MRGAETKAIISKPLLATESVESFDKFGTQEFKLLKKSNFDKIIAERQAKGAAV